MAKDIEKEVNKVDYQIPSDEMVKVTKAGNAILAQDLKFRNDKQTVKKLSKHSYEIMSTHKIGFYDNSSERRTDNIESLRRTIGKNRLKMEANFKGSKNEFMITFTYAEKVYDIDILNRDINRFNTRFKRWNAENGYGEIVYVDAREAHDDGGWHFHMLVKFKDIDEKKGLFIPNKFEYPENKNKKFEKNKKYRPHTFEEIKEAKVDAPIFDLWGHGFVNVQRLDHINSVANYLSSYLTNVPVEELEKGNLEKYISSGKKVSETKSDMSKKVVKGLRLQFFPRSKRIFTWSNNAVEPEEFFMRYGDVRKTFGISDENLAYRSSVEVTMNREGYDKPFVQRVVVEEYNLKTKNNNNIYTKKSDWVEFKKTTNDYFKKLSLKSNISNSDILGASIALKELSDRFVSWFHWHKISDYNDERDWKTRSHYKNKLIKEKYEELSETYFNTFNIKVANIEKFNLHL